MAGERGQRAGVRRPKAVAGVVGLGALLAGLVVACSGGSGGGSGGDGAGPPDDARPAAVGEPIDLSAPGIHELADPPISDRGERGGALTVAAGDRIVYWGGGAQDDASAPGVLRDDGAVLSLADGRWTPMPASPFDDGLYRGIGVWDGTEVIFVGTDCEGEVPPVTEGGPPSCPRGPAAAAFDPEALRWRELPPPPIAVDPDYDVAIFGHRPLAVGGGGRAIVSHGFRGDAITWDRATESWGTVESPAPEGRPFEDIADEVGGQIVGVMPEPVGAGWVSSLYVLPLGADAWEPTVGLDREVKEVFSAGDGYLTSSGLDTTQPGRGGARSLGVLVDVDTGEILDAFPPSPDLRYSWILGPWLFAQSSITAGDLDGDDVPKPIDARLVRGGQIVELDEPMGDALQVYVPGVGAISGSFGPGEPMLLWRAPPSLAP